VGLHVLDSGRRGSSPARPTAASVPAAKGLGLLTTQSELLNGLVVPFNEMIRSSPTCSRKINYAFKTYLNLAPAIS
jgi:hypothetical protein